MIEYCKTPFDAGESLDSLNIFIRKWFEGKYREPTPPQRYSFKLIREGRNLLITAPTGSGQDLVGVHLHNKQAVRISAPGEARGQGVLHLHVAARGPEQRHIQEPHEPLEEIYDTIMNENTDGTKIMSR